MIASPTGSYHLLLSAAFAMVVAVSAHPNPTDCPPGLPPSYANQQSAMGPPQPYPSTVMQQYYAMNLDQQQQQQPQWVPQPMMIMTMPPPPPQTTTTPAPFPGVDPMAEIGRQVHQFVLQSGAQGTSMTVANGVVMRGGQAGAAANIVMLPNSLLPVQTRPAPTTSPSTTTSSTTTAPTSSYSKTTTPATTAPTPGPTMSSSRSATTPTRPMTTTSSPASSPSPSWNVSSVIQPSSSSSSTIQSAGANNISMTSQRTSPTITDLIGSLMNGSQLIMTSSQPMSQTTDNSTASATTDNSTAPATTPIKGSVSELVAWLINGSTSTSSNNNVTSTTNGTVAEQIAWLIDQTPQAGGVASNRTVSDLIDWLQDRNQTESNNRTETVSEMVKWLMGNVSASNPNSYGAGTTEPAPATKATYRPRQNPTESSPKGTIIDLLRSLKI